MAEEKPMRGIKRLLVSGGIFTLLAALWNCVTPVIPLPPPRSLKLELIDTSRKMITLSGQSAGGSLVYILNQDTGGGVISQADEEDGTFTSPELRAEDKHRLLIWSARWTDDAPSETTCMEVNYQNRTLNVCP
jgi:hypothetical protein